MERLQAYMRKAAREAKLHTSWINPNEAHERVTCMRYRRICKHSFHIVLHNRDNIADSHRHDCENDEHSKPSVMNFASYCLARGSHDEWKSEHKHPHK